MEKFFRSNWSKRGLSAFLALVLIFASVSVHAVSAAEVTEEVVEVIETEVVATEESFDVLNTVSNLTAGAWFESVYAVWHGTPGTTYNVHVSPAGQNQWRWVNNPSEQVTGQSTWRNNHSLLVRNIGGTVFRADVPGLRAIDGETYDIQIRAANNTTVLATATDLAPRAFDRTGYMFSPQSRYGPANAATPHLGGFPFVGGYNRDGTVPANAVVIYVTHQNMNNLTTPWGNDRGLANDSLFPPGGGRARNRPSNDATAANTTPLILRFVGQVGQATIGPLGSGDHRGHAMTNAVLPNGLQSVPNENMLRVQDTFNVTFEGIGPDATIFGWGIHSNRNSNMEFRNLNMRWYPDDGIRVQGGNNTANANTDLAGIGTHNTWVHHNTFHIGSDRAGGASDQNFGDGTLDFVDGASFATNAHNHFIQTDKTGLINGATGRPFSRHTIHNNWFQQTRSRTPRVRMAAVHVFNNFYDRVTGYGIGAGEHANIISEGNYFYRTSWPHLINGHGNTTLSSDPAGALVTNRVTGVAGLGLHALVPNTMNNVSDHNPTRDEGIWVGQNNRQGTNTFGSPNRPAHTFGWLGSPDRDDAQQVNMRPAQFYSFTVAPADAALQSRIRVNAGTIHAREPGGTAPTPPPTPSPGAPTPTPGGGGDHHSPY